MKCSCGSDVTGKKFCQQCGRRVSVMIVTCLHCNNQFNGRFCTECGAEAGSMPVIAVPLCSNCGASVNGGKFCTECGSPLTSSKITTTRTTKTVVFEQSAHPSVSRAAITISKTKESAPLQFSPSVAKVPYDTAAYINSDINKLQPKINSHSYKISKCVDYEPQRPGVYISENELNKDRGIDRHARKQSEFTTTEADKKFQERILNARMKRQNDEIRRKELSEQKRALAIAKMHGRHSNIF